MQWDIPDTDPIQSRNIQPSDFHASEIVYVCWRVAEKHIQAHKFGEAAILLERLLASPYGCTSPELELNSRIRLAWLYSTNSSLIRVAVEHIERAVREMSISRLTVASVHSVY